MNFPFSFYIKTTLLLTLAGSVIQVSGQNAPVPAQTTPDGVANPFTVPPALPSQGEGVGYNYTRSFAPAVPFTNEQDVSETSAPADVHISTTFRDGFNRDMQTVIRNFTNSTRPHLVLPVDTRFQRDGYSYLPYATNNDNSTAADPLAGYHNQAFQEQKDYYTMLYPGEGYTSFSRERYVSGSAERSTLSFSPGKSQVGQDRGTSTKIITNNAAEIRMWSLNGSGMPVSSGFYPANMLYGTESSNVHGSSVTSFKDKDGTLVCQKVYLENIISGSAVTPVYGFTYYVYDEMGKLRYTLPPKAVNLIAGGTLTQAQIDQLCYRYLYNDRGQIVEQQLPGKAAEYYVYDKRNRQVFYQDGLLRSQAKWAYTFYDAMDRPTVTGVGGSSRNRLQMIDVIEDPYTGYPTTSWLYYIKNYDLWNVYLPDNVDVDVYTCTYYDDYHLTDPTGSLWDTYNTVLQFNEQVSAPGSETPWISNRTKGRVTGTKVRILASPTADVSKIGEWRTDATFYDEKGRAFYAVSRDLYQGTAIHAHYTGTQYDFANRVLISKHVVRNTNSTGTQDHTELNRNYYDANSGRLTQSRRKTDNGAWQIQAINSYDELGRVSRSILGNYGEVRDLNYNIRGQLAGINDYYTRTGDKQGESRTFGEILRYDYGFGQLRYDGKVAGMFWRGAGNGMPSAYGYTYDQGGRLTLADYYREQNMPTLPPSTSWTKSNADYTVSNLKYDLNGNLTKMDQKAVKPGTGIVTMDKLNYTYGQSGQSNQLLRVIDSATFYDLGDFNNTNGIANDYTYDPNGNLNLDNNKSISQVSYNHLNKPQTVTFSNGKKIEYSYDAAGGKVQELVLQPGLPTQRTDYVGNFIYEDDNLKYAMTGEGRSIYIPAANRFNEEYFIKDHLGNVRSVIDMTVAPIQEYLASYEIASANLEGLFFEHHDQVRDDKPGGSAGDGKAGNLVGSDPDKRIGTALLLKVMAGDKVEMNVNSFYEGYNGNEDKPVTPEDMLSTIVSTLTTGAGGWQGGESHNTELVDKAFTPGNYQSFGEMLQSTTDPGKPKAYLNYLFFDENMQLVKELSGAFQATSDGSWLPIGTTVPMEIGHNGYLAVYLSNATQGLACEPCNHVYFDQLAVSFSKGNLKEETHYYPHGLPMAGMGSAASNLVENRNKYQANEYIKDLGLNWMDFHNRQYDPQIGRFLSVDPLAAATVNMSPYTGMNNNPVSVVDPLGLQGENISTPNVYDHATPIPLGLSALRDGGRSQLSGFFSGFNGVIDEVLVQRELAAKKGEAMLNNMLAKYSNTSATQGSSTVQNNSPSGGTGTSDVGSPNPQSGSGDGGGSEGSKKDGQTWYYMYRVTGAAHGMAYDPITETIYEVNHPKDKNGKEENGVVSWAKGGRKSTAYRWRQEVGEEWSKLVEREAGNLYALCPVYLPNPEAATNWFQSQTGKTFDYNIVTNNCSSYSLDGLAAGGGKIWHQGSPEPSCVTVKPTRYWYFKP